MKLSIRKQTYTLCVQALEEKIASFGDGVLSNKEYNRRREVKRALRQMRQEKDKQ